MNMVKATRRFEEWLRRRTAVVEPDLRTKHKHMAEAAFPFLRATFYRWMQVWPEVCSDLAKAPKVLAVGDLHIENFGTWRDAEGRLIWGVNDFDEAAEVPYTNDLLRLATSAILAAEEGHLALKPKEACNAILDGYGKSLAEHGGAFVLEEEHKWLRQIATGELRDPVPFWKKMDGLPEVKSAIPASAREGPTEILYPAIMNHAVRAPDPFVQVRGRWIVRRLSPHCSRIELSLLPKNRDECRLLFAMGWETANIHLGSRGALKEVRRHLETLTRRQLESDAQAMTKAVRKDWQRWRDSGEA